MGSRRDCRDGGQILSREQFAEIFYEWKDIYDQYVTSHNLVRPARRSGKLRL